MCGIAGVVDLTGKRSVPSGVLRAMTDALYHRGPDEDGYLSEPGVAPGSRRLSIVGLASGKQPIGNEDGGFSVAFNGELYDYPPTRARRAADIDLPRIAIPSWCRIFGRITARARSSGCAGVCPALGPNARRLFLSRDRFGICPLYWTRQVRDDGEWVLFASEIKALLASGMVTPRPDLAVSTRRLPSFDAGAATRVCRGLFLLPGHYLSIRQDGARANDWNIAPIGTWIFRPRRRGARPGSKEAGGRLRECHASGSPTTPAGGRAGCLLSKRRGRFEPGGGTGSRAREPIPTFTRASTRPVSMRPRRPA